MTADYTKIFNSYNGVGLSTNTPIFGGTGTPDTEVTGSPPDGSIYHRSNGEMYKRISSVWTKVIEADGQATSAVDSDALGGQAAANYARTDIAETFDNNVTLSSGTLGVTGIINIDNLRLDGNTLSTTNTNGDLTLAPNGTGDVIVGGDLIVNGTTTTVNSNEVNVGDAIIKLNSDETGAPSQDAGLEIERGTSTNAFLIFDETNDYWVLDNGDAVQRRLLTTSDEGTGNGLDADTVDGLEASQFVRSDTGDTLTGTYTVTGQWNVDNLRLDTNTLSSTSGDITLSPTGNATVDGNRILTVADEGSGNGLDADTLDGVQGASYLRSDTNDTFTGILTVTGELRPDNLSFNANAITSTNTNGDITITPNGTGDIVLDGQNWPQADGASDQVLTTDGAGQLSWQDAAQPENQVVQTSTSVSAATETTIDSVLVDDALAVEWSVAVHENTGTDVEMVTVHAVHNGVNGADAASVDFSEFAQLVVGTVDGLTFTVDLSGSGAAQTMRLRCTTTNATTAKVARKQVSL